MGSLLEILSARSWEPYFRRYDERTFCYELYHQLRCLIDEHRRTNALADDGVRLQGELTKKHIGEVAASILGGEAGVTVTALEREYIPDFLLHTPGNFKSQGLVMEVKTAADIPLRDIKSDLLKLQEFVQKYAYGRALFLVTNNSIQRIQEILGQTETINWIRDELPARSQILLYCKEGPRRPSFECNLDRVDSTCRSV
jgi:hypothetical protein